MTFKMTKKNMLQHHRLCSTAPEATVPLSEWTPIYRLRTNAGKWTYSLQPMTRQTPPSVQIHHTGHDHWVLSIQDTSGTVFLFDSKNPRQTVSASTQIQVSRIYSSNGNVIPVNLPTVQQQTNSIDCGAFAI
jgi:hypothetical protein